ncbi:UDP-2,4-diacetamido-2,4,6-trideoxy-beta-L-altropyranose hydrolase [Paenibacillus wenxiniae]|uniref:UDP-2,4-diacetamido-2,4, 6-trideoxy-beta-L-altropyranose hydrolase n=1 Tax=Paenibacillus wenxiniae TaxID=1636843 RepID=A0ABW4RHF5_9BACL
MKVIAFRVDASSTIGIGHIKRCLTLADQLNTTIDEVKIIFICNDLLPKLIKSEIEYKGCELKLISSPPTKEEFNPLEDAYETRQILVEQQHVDLLIIDHYQIDSIWEQLFVDIVPQILVIDDLANRMHTCHALLDQNLYDNFEQRYKNLVPEQCTLFLGPEFLLLRNEFYEHLNQYKQDYHSLTHIALSFGGSDPTGEITRILMMIPEFRRYLPHLVFHVVAGPANIEASRIEQHCNELNDVFFYNDPPIAELFSQMDLVIGAGGVMMWERCFIGLPSAVITVAENQIESVIEAEKNELIWHLGYTDQITSGKLIEFLVHVCSNLDELQKKNKSCRMFMQQTRSSLTHPIIKWFKQKEAI